MTEPKNPFRVGMSAVFLPDERTVGWHQHSFDRWELFPGDAGTITDVVDGAYVVLDGRQDAAMHWSQFRAADSVPQAERDAARLKYDDGS
jgi:hypothetical protein